MFEIIASGLNYGLCKNMNNFKRTSHIMAESARIYLLAVTLWGIMSQTAGENLVIDPRQPQVKQIGVGAIFTCTIEQYVHYGREEPDIFWRASHGELITDTRGRVHVERIATEQLRLYISHVAVEDAGLYSCEAIINGVLFTVDTRLEIYEDIEFRDSPDKVYYRAGDDAFIECGATGHPQPEISWRFNRKPIISDDKKYRYEEQRGLRIYNLNREDAGFYECRAEVTSQGNLKVKAISMDVKYKPFLSYRPPDVTEVILGERAELRCQGLGNPEITYKWFKEHEAGAHAKVKVMLPQQTDTLVMTPQSRDDGGKYYCRVSNELGSEETATEVIVLERPMIQDLQAERIHEMVVLFLNCRYSGFPVPVVTWQREGSNKPFIHGIQPDDARVKVDNTRPGVSQLIISDIDRSYTGRYTCSASNKAGNYSSTANITVDYKPTVSSVITEQTAWPGQTRNFTCVGDGRPLPTMNWLSQGQYISNSSTYRVYTQIGDLVTSTIQIHVKPDQPWVYGEYSCVAKNRYDYVTSNVHLLQATVPDMPRNMTVMDETPSTVHMTASLPGNQGGLQVTSWRLQYQRTKMATIEEFTDPEDYTEEEIEIIFGRDDKLEVVGLDAGIEYNFYLSAGNDVGYSVPLKFKIKTPKHKEQADLPGHPDEREAGILRTGAEGKEALNYNNKFKEVASDTPAPSLTSIAIAVGATVVGVVVVVLVGVAICLRKRSRAKEDDYTSTWRGMFGNGKKVPMGDDAAVVKISESKDIDQMQLEIRRIDGSQPDLIAQASPKPNHLDRCRSPLEIRKQNGYTGSPKKNPRELNAGTPNSIQQRAWDHMLMAKDLETEDPALLGAAEKQEELTPMMDLPPPPQFLLDNSQEPAAISDNISYHDILDGYHSEDNNIDDGDEFVIHTPHLTNYRHDFPET